MHNSRSALPATPPSTSDDRPTSVTIRPNSTIPLSRHTKATSYVFKYGDISVVIDQTGEARLNTGHGIVVIASAAEYRKNRGFIEEVERSGGGEIANQFQQVLIDENWLGDVFGNLPSKIADTLRNSPNLDASAVLRRLAGDWLSAGSLEFRGTSGEGELLSVIATLGTSDRKLLEGVFAGSRG